MSSGTARVEIFDPVPTRGVVEDVVKTRDIGLDRLQVGPELDESLNRTGETLGESLEGDQAAYGDCAFDNAQAADGKHRNRGQGREQRRDDVQQVRQDSEFLLVGERVGVHAGPAFEKVVFKAACLQRLDHVHPVDRGPDDFPHFPEHAATRVLAPAGNQPERQQVKGDHQEGNQREHRVVEEHDRSVHDHGQHARQVDREFIRYHPDDLVVRLHPVRDVTCKALPEEGQWQRGNVPEKMHARDHGELDLHAAETDLLHPGKRGLENRGKSQADEQRDDHGAASWNQYVVDEHLGKRRNGQAGNDLHERAENDESHRRVGLAETGQQSARQARPGA